MKNHIVVLLLFLVCSASLFGGGWTQGKGKGYFKFGQTVIHGNQFFNGEGKTKQITTTGIYQTTVYGEYGITDRLDGIFYAPIFSRITLNKIQFASGDTQDGDEYNGIGDSQIGVKYGLLKDGKIALSASLILGLPLGNPSGGETELLQTGDGEFNQMLMIDAGFSLSKHFYGNVAVGFNHRTEGFSEEFRWNVEIGYYQDKKFLIALKSFNVHSFKNGEPEGSAGNGIFSNNIEFNSIGPEISYWLTDKMGVSASYQTAFSGSLILAEPAYAFGVFYQLR